MSSDSVSPSGKAATSRTRRRLCAGQFCARCLQNAFYGQVYAVKGRVRKTASRTTRRVLHFLEHCAASAFPSRMSRRRRLTRPTAKSEGRHCGARRKASRQSSSAGGSSFSEESVHSPSRSVSSPSSRNRARQPPGIRGRQVVFPLRVISRDGLNRMEGGRKHCGFHERQNLFEPDFPLLPIEAGGLIRKADQPFPRAEWGMLRIPPKGA